jgi:hypothetical protein
MCEWLIKVPRNGSNWFVFWSHTWRNIFSDLICCVVPAVVTVVAREGQQLTLAK